MEMTLFEIQEELSDALLFLRVAALTQKMLKKEFDTFPNSDDVLFACLYDTICTVADQSEALYVLVRLLSERITVPH